MRYQYKKRLMTFLCVLLNCTVLTLNGPLLRVCFGQNTREIEAILPKEIRNRVDVELIVEKLRFLRMNESNLGENHPNKKSAQAQIREYEFDLKSLIELTKSRETKAASREGLVTLENTLPPEFANREEVQSIVRKLRFLRMNNKYLGENHPSKRSTTEQIRGHEFALSKLLDEDRLPSPKPTEQVRPDLTKVRPSQENENRRELRVTWQKLVVLKANQANYGENHPNWSIIQNEIRDHESKLRELTQISD